MEFITNLSKEEYKRFADKHPKAHFLQSYEWGQFCGEAKKQIPHYIGLKDNTGTLVAASLILEKKTPIGWSYGYAPRGFLADYNNHELLKEWTNYLNKYMKDNRYIYIKFDPDIKYHDIDEEAMPIENGENNYDLYKYMLSIGYKHTGFYKLYEGNQPRYTFRINLKRDLEEITNAFNKSFNKSLKRSYDYDLIIDNEICLDDFYRLLKSNSSKDDFDPHSKEYYQAFIDNMKNNTMKFFNASIKAKELASKIKEELDKEEALLATNPKRIEDIKNKIAKLKKDYETFSTIDTDKLVVCSLICTYTDKRAWSLYIGSDNLANQTFAVSRCYFEAIKDAHDNGFDFFDLFGTVGDPHTTYKNLAHLHDYKRKFGDEYIEFIGEFDLVNKKMLYHILPVLLKIYRKLRR